jgi:hypothetical protein
VPVNVLGNAIATLVIARMERALDVAALESELRRPVGVEIPVDTVEIDRAALALSERPRVEGLERS